MPKLIAILLTIIALVMAVPAFADDHPVSKGLDLSDLPAGALPSTAISKTERNSLTKIGKLDPALAKKVENKLKATSNLRNRIVYLARQIFKIREKIDYAELSYKKGVIDKSLYNSLSQIESGLIEIEQRQKINYKSILSSSDGYSFYVKIFLDVIRSEKFRSERRKRLGLHKEVGKTERPKKGTKQTTKDCSAGETPESECDQMAIGTNPSGNITVYARDKSDQAKIVDNLANLCFWEDAEEIIAELDGVLEESVDRANKTLAELGSVNSNICEADHSRLLTPPHYEDEAGTSGGIVLASLRGMRQSSQIINDRPVPDLRFVQQTAATPNVTSPTGPLPGMDFNQFKSELSQFGGHGEIRKIKKEMTENAGRDELLQRNDWATFKRQYETAKRNLKQGLEEKDPKKKAEALARSEIAYGSMRETHNKLLDRRKKLLELQKKVDQQFARTNVKTYFKELDERIERSRQLESEMGGSIRKVGGWVKKIYDRLKNKRVPLISIAEDLICIAKDLTNLSAALHEDSIIRTYRPYVMDLLEMEGALELLLAQYDARIEAESELLDEFLDALIDGSKACN